MTVTANPRVPPPSASPCGASTPTSTPRPARGELGQYLPEPWRSKYFGTHTVGEQIYYDAPDYAHSYAMRVDTFPAGRRVRRAAIPDLAFKQLIMEAGADIAILEPAAYPARIPEANSAMSGAEPLAGQPLARQPQQLARAVARVDLRDDRGAGGRSPRDRGSGPGTRTWRRF